jgi:hypothetical protein
MANVQSLFGVSLRNYSMAADSESSLTKCPICRSLIEIDFALDQNAAHAYGGLILQCLSCGKLFEEYVGWDARRSSIRNGAKIVDRYDEIAADREWILRKHGLLER